MPGNDPKNADYVPAAQGMHETLRITGDTCAWHGSPGGLPRPHATCLTGSVAKLCWHLETALWLATDVAEMLQKLICLKEAGSAGMEVT